MNEPSASAADLPAVLAAFELRLQADRDAGCVATVAEYQALYPGFERAIARAFARAQPRADGDEFVERYRADLARGQVASLREYLRGYPGREAEVASRFAELEAARAGAAGASAELPGGGQVGPYRLERELGRGGQGVVYLAHDQRLNRAVALKVLNQIATCSTATLRRFEREAEIASRLDHPGICPVYDVGRVGGAPFLVMRHVAGTTLAHKLAQARAGDGSVLASPRAADLAAILACFEGAARALHVAHEAGIVHRDVKPGNLMVAPSGEPVLLDFGLAQLQDDADWLTLTHDRLGTPAYMAPEQLRTGEVIDRRTDVHALGVALYECLTLRRPYEAPTAEGVFSAILSGSYIEPRQHRRDLPRDLDTVVRTALEPDRQRRYRTALDLAEDLARLRRGEPVLAQRPSVWRRLRRFARRNPGVAAALATTFIALLAITLWTEHKNRELDRALGEARWLADAKLVERFNDASLHLARGDVDDLPQLDRWLTQAHEFLGRAAQHGTRLARIEVSGGDPQEIEGLRDLLRRLEEFSTEHGTLARIARRRDVLAVATALAAGPHRDAWAAAGAAVAADPRFAALSLAPQLGLVPLGADPASGLQEFAALDTGDVPTRGADGRLVRNETAAVVFVLLPGGAFTMGCEPDSPAGQSTASPPHLVSLAPFLLSKYELTQAQYRHIVGNNPAGILPGAGVAGQPPITLAHPVESLSWLTCRELAQVSGWVLSTEAQWEYAARAGTRTRWHSGDQRESLLGVANLYDHTLHRLNPVPGVEFWPEFEDGHPLHAPTGLFAANGFGLHDMHGNVAEWCRDRVFGYTHPVVGDEGERYPTEPGGRCVIRGGSFIQDTTTCAVYWRDAMKLGDHATSVGLRPARRLRR